LIALAILVVLIFAGSVYADYRWRKWVDARRRDRDGSNPSIGR